MTHVALSGGGSRSPFPGSVMLKTAEPTIINATHFCAASDAPAAPTGISTMNAIGIGIEPDRGHDTSGGTLVGASGGDSGGACGGCG